MATTDDIPGRIIDLPIGPVQAGATVTVETVEADGTVTALASGFWLETGRYPRLRFGDTDPEERLRITYTAGIAADPADLPADLRQAIIEQAVRTFDQRGGVEDRGPALSANTALIIARYRGVRV